MKAMFGFGPGIQVLGAERVGAEWVVSVSAWRGPVSGLRLSLEGSAQQLLATATGPSDAWHTGRSSPAGRPPEMSRGHL